MKTLTGLCIAGILILNSSIAHGQGQADSRQIQEVVNELIAQLPKGTIKHGKALPRFIEDAIKELAKLSPETEEVEILRIGVVIITDMDRYLDFKGVISSEQREVIKSRGVAFTINEQWPIYINGESELYKTAVEMGKSSALRNYSALDHASLAAGREPRLEADNPFVHKFAAVLWHEMVHARGQADEAIAIREEIKLLERLHGRRLVELEWVHARKLNLVQIQKGQVPNGPMQLKTSKP